MNKLSIATAITIALFSSTPVLAESVTADVEDHYRTVVRQVPETELVCDTIEVPIYGEDRFDQGGAIIGGIIGGVLGNQVGKGRGNDVATGAGAVAGAIIGGKKHGGVVGYRQEERCHRHTTYSRVEEEVYSHSTVRFLQDGRWVTLRFQR